MRDKESTWPNEIYRYTEFYYWEPRHLGKQSKCDRMGCTRLKTDGRTLARVQKRIREIEVPLNTLFSISLRLLPSGIINRLLNSFGVDVPKGRFELIDLLSDAEGRAEYGNFTHPDVALEDEVARVFVEIKVDALLSRDQIWKYLFLHASRQRNTGQSKAPFLFLLTRDPLPKQWDSKERAKVFEKGNGAKHLLDHMRAARVPDKLGDKKSLAHLQEQVRDVLERVKIGHCTWKQIGDFLRRERDELRRARAENEHADATHRLIDDLLADLARRQLWSEERK